MDDLQSFTDVLGDEIPNSQPMSLPSTNEFDVDEECTSDTNAIRPAKGTGQHEQFRSIEEIDAKYRRVFTYPYFNLVQSSVIEDALYSDKSMVVCAPTGSGKTVIFEMAIVQLLMYLEDEHYTDDFKIIYMAPVKALCTERLSEWYPKFTKLGLLCIVVTGDTDVDFSQLKPYRIIITTPEKWDMLTRRWRDHRSLVEVIKLFLIDEVHILNDESRGPALEVVVSRMKTIESSAQSAYRIEQLQKKYRGGEFVSENPPPKIRFVAVSATVGNPEDVASWIGNADNPAVFYRFGDECRPVKLKRVVEGYPCSEGTSIFKFDIVLNYKLWPIIQKYHNGKPTLIFCNTRKSVVLTAEMLSREITINFSPDQKAQLIALASTLKNKKLQSLILSGVGCHHAGLLFEERTNIERAFRNRDLPILITTTTLAMGVNLPAHLVIIKNTQQYVNGAYQEYSISTVLQMVGRAGRPQYDTEATAVIMTRLADKHRYQALVGGSEPLQSYLHKRLPENLNSEAALGTVTDVAQCVQWLRSTFLWVRARRDPKRYLGLPAIASQQLISKKIEELCMKAMNGLKSTGLITMDEACCIESTEAGRLMSIYYIDLETMKHIMKIEGNETLERLLYIVCESHELADMHLRVDERRCLNALNRSSTATTIRFPMKGKITTRQMKVNCIIQAVLGCLPISDPSLNQEAMKVMRVADRVCKCLVAYVTRPDLISQEPQFFSAVLNSLILAKCISAQLWENSPFLSRQLKGIGPTISALLASAGKVNLLMLKESHPRDLERIMNKGPPAGNILLKQVCLLPKYILTATAIDEKTVKIQLVLQNQSYLADNLDHLTAGDAHKCYVVVGDSENHVLLLTSIKDKDLINIYVGNISYKITRKHDFEHKVYAYCMSSNFVGIDDECEYTFQDLHPTFSHPYEDINTKTIQKKQSLITDNFNERKRKNVKNITETKEKKRRESPIIEKFNCLKESLRVPSKPLIENFTNTMDMRDKLDSYQDVSIPVTINSTKTIDDKNNNLATEMFAEGNEPDQFDHKINSLLNEIESEISRHQKDSTTDDISEQNCTLNSHLNFSKDAKTTHQNILPSNSTNKYSGNKSLSTKQLLLNKQKRQKITKNHNKSNFKSNYNFIDLLDKNVNYSDDEEKDCSNNDTGFSKAIKPGIDNYLMQTKSNSTDFNSIINKILETSTDAEIPKIDTRERNLHNAVDIKNNINNEVVKQLCNEEDKIDNTNNLKENEAITLKNIPCHINLQRNSCNEETHNMVKPCNTLNISNDMKNSNNNYNKILCLTQGLSQTAKTLKNSDNTYHKYAAIISPFCLLKTRDKESCKELAFSNKAITSVNCIENLENQFDNIRGKVKNNPSEHIKKCSCTSTKIDICTNRQSDQIIHVRKLKMNLDITEAVYFANNCDIELDNFTKKELTQVTVGPLYKPIAIKNKLRNISDSISLPNVKVHQIEETNRPRDHKLDVFNIPHNLHDLSKPIEYMSILNKDQNLSEKALNPSMNKIRTNFELGVTNNASLHNYSTELQNDIKVIDLENVQKNNITNSEKLVECENTCTIQNPQTLSDNDTISDILQKYKKLYQNNQNEQDFVKGNLNKVVDSKNTIELKKSKKPFKIVDIDNIRVSLPNILIDVSPTKIASLSTLQVKDANHNEEIRDIEDQLLLATPISNESVPDLQIDQSMFNPKTLLFCLGKDNNYEIIPPPLEYRDKSTGNTPEDTHMFTSDLNEDIQNIYDSSQYQKQDTLDSDQISAASEKMEYWILSREDSQEYHNSYSLNLLNQVKCPESSHWTNHNNSISECILDQFKFKHKEKMKVNRNIRLDNSN